MHVPTIIERKRDGHELTGKEIEFLVSGFTRGEIPDYQMSALAMAVYFRGMTADETSKKTDHGAEANFSLPGMSDHGVGDDS
jgi:pyrimidine-nucleoside phosphorylase